MLWFKLQTFKGTSSLFPGPTIEHNLSTLVGMQWDKGIVAVLPLVYAVDTVVQFVTLFYAAGTEVQWLVFLQA